MSFQIICILLFRSDYHMQSVEIPSDISDNQFKTSEICTADPNFTCKCLNPLWTFPIVILKTSEIRMENLINTMRYQKIIWIFLILTWKRCIKTYYISLLCFLMFYLNFLKI